jgi:hypothetical protein
MALIASLAALCGVALFAVVCTGLGHRALRTARLTIENDIERLLYSVAAGVIVFEAALAMAEFVAPVRASVIVLLAAAFVFGVSDWKAILEAASRVARRIASGSRAEYFLAALVGGVLLLEGVAAMAPLTGSDALHYHFAEPLRTLRTGFHPDFFVTTSFLTGQGHLLILAGLALSSEKLAMGFLYLPGALTAVAAAFLARQWVSRPWAWLVALAFLLNPVVFWQISTAGVPDLWMTFFATAAVLLIARARDSTSAASATLCGVLAGGLAGAKYVGCVFAAALLVAYVWESRSLQRAALFIAGSLGVGIWPYLRNFVWTGDPVFPYALRWLAPSRVNAHALAYLIETTVVRGQRSIEALWRFPLFAAVNRSNVGFWELFGPCCLLFLPLFIWKAKRTAYWRAALIVTMCSGLGIGLTSGMARYVLPVLPVALAAAFAGAAAIVAEGWKFARGIMAVSIAGFLLLGAGGFAIYARPALFAGAGLTSREDYLQQRAPDYAICEFVNRTLAGKGSEGNVLVFFRHVYPLQVPYLYGDPQDSWAIDPDRLATPEAWRDFLRQNRIRWILRAPEYPEDIAAPLEKLERDGVLTPFAREDVTTFEGMRILGIRKTMTASILQVND